MNYWGPNLARNFDRLDGCRVTWICDRDEAVLDRHRSAVPRQPLHDPRTRTCWRTPTSTPW